jgi:hypothetical protein
MTTETNKGVICYIAKPGELSESQAAKFRELQEQVADELMSRPYRSRIQGVEPMNAQTTNQTTGRFQVGQEIYVLATVSDDRNYIYPNLARIASGEAKMFLKKLTVTEHHKVTNGFSEEKECDGYLLTDGESVFTNQFPEACYGQTTDQANHLFKTGLYNKSNEELDDAFKNQASKPIFWNGITNMLGDLVAFQRTGRAAEEIGKVIGVISVEFEKAFPGKTLTVYDSKVASSEIVTVEVEDKIN